MSASSKLLRNNGCHYSAKNYSIISIGLFASALLATIVQHAAACIGSGICGGGGGCYSPPPVACGGGCQPGYQCGNYGCARRRARVHAANTFASAGGVTDKNEYERIARKPISKQQLLTAEKSGGSSFGPRDPNQMFLECCEDRGLPDACLHHCNFNTYTKEALMGMYFKTNACPIEAAAELQYCAARGRDHRACCVRNSVQTTLAGEKCLTFCDQRPGNVTQLDFSYASCYDRFEQMKGCFWHSALSGH